jgi:hypothetical protein
LYTVVRILNMVRLGPACVNGYGRPISPLLPAGYAHPRLTPHAQRHESIMASADPPRTGLARTDLTGSFPTERAPLEGFSPALAHVL